MTAGLRIAFFGSSLVSAYWNGAATYYRGIIRALHERGHRVTFFEPDAYERQRHRDIDDPPWARVVVYSVTDEADIDRVLAEARGADVIVKASGVGTFDPLLEQAIADMHTPTTFTIFWDVDAPATLDRVLHDQADPFRALIPRYDLVLTYGGGDPVVAAYERLGARHCVPVYNALDPLTHYRVASDARFVSDLALLANRLPDRETRVEEFFFAAAGAMPHRAFLLGGSGWANRGLPRNVSYVGHVYTRDHNAFNSTSATILNVTRDSMAHYGFSPPTRIFEAGGAGACIITDHWEGVELFLSPGDEVLVAANGAAVVAHLQALTPSRARTIGQAARRRLLAEHTYAHRAVQVERVLDVTGRGHWGAVS